MSRSFYARAAVLAVSLPLAACGGSSYSSGSSSPSSAATASPAAATQPSGAAVVKTAPNSSLGATILVDSAGMTLYRLSGESAGKFICTSSACLSVWHPLKAQAGVTPSGAASLGVVKRPDGSSQVTYAGGPLYTFASDRAPGQANGQGLRDVGTWGVVKVGSASGSAASESAPSEPAETGSEGGYHY